MAQQVAAKKTPEPNLAEPAPTEPEKPADPAWLTALKQVGPIITAVSLLVTAGTGVFAAVKSWGTSDTLHMSERLDSENTRFGNVWNATNHAWACNMIPRDEEGRWSRYCACVFRNGDGTCDGKDFYTIANVGADSRTECGAKEGVEVCSCQDQSVCGTKAEIPKTTQNQQ